jgi:hypothetical protein
VIVCVISLSITKAIQPCVVSWVPILEKKNIVGRELVVQFSKKGGWYETWPSTTFATDTAAACTTGTAGFLPRLVFVQLSARPELGSKKII